VKWLERQREVEEELELERARLERQREVELEREAQTKQDRLLERLKESKRWFEVLSSPGWKANSKNIAVHKPTNEQIEVTKDVINNKHRVYTTASPKTKLRVGYGDTIKEAYRALALEMTKDPIDNFELQQK